MGMGYHVIVIGAGMAGLAAARTLQTADFSVKIVEGRERIGGRTHTDSSLGADIDLGAAWIHGPIGNPLMPLAQQFGVGTGNYEKIALKFPHIFWPLAPQWFNYLGDEETPLYAAWLNNAHFSGRPILIATHAGSCAHHTNQLSDEAVIAGCLKTLRLMFGPNVPEPVAYVRSGWEHDPFSLGSYSYNKVGGQVGDRLMLGGIVDGRLFFAGEATHPNYFGTVHAAYETGIRAARELVEAVER
jgi:monoamine oxidase